MISGEQRTTRSGLSLPCHALIQGGRVARWWITEKITAHREGKWEKQRVNTSERQQTIALQPTCPCLSFDLSNHTVGRGKASPMGQK